MALQNAHNRWFILFYHVWGPTCIKIHWNSIWLRACSHMTPHYTWVSMTAFHDFGGVLGWPLNTFFWALTISWSRLLARVWSGPNLLQSMPKSHLWETMQKLEISIDDTTYTKNLRFSHLSMLPKQRLPRLQRERLTNGSLKLIS